MTRICVGQQAPKYVVHLLKRITTHNVQSSVPDSKGVEGYGDAPQISVPPVMNISRAGDPFHTRPAIGSRANVIITKLSTVVITQSRPSIIPLFLHFSLLFKFVKQEF